MQQKRYWTPSYLPKYEMDEVVAVEELEKQLRNSVRSMMIADVPLGVFVSGGIDSSLIASLMQAESGKKVKIFSIALDEHKYATQVACYLNAEYYPLTITAKDIVGALDQMFDEPFGDQAALPTLLLSKLTSKHLKGVMTGEGADEVFAGYNNYVKRLKQARFCDKYRPFGLSYLYPLLPMKLRKDRFVKALSRPISRRYTTIASLFDSEMHRRILKFRSKITLEDLAEPLYHNCNSNEYLDRMLHIDQNLWLAEDLLTKVDRATMTYSLEARVPYLDHRLVEFAARLPVSYKLKEGDGKYLLKQVAKKGFVPPQIIQRPKSGFVLPLHQWMQQDLKPVMKDTLASLCNRSLFKRGFLNKKHHPTRLFALLALEFWFRRYAPHYKVSKVAK